MAQINVRLNDERYESLRRYASSRRTPVAWLIKDYIDYLLAGGEPVTPSDEVVTASDLATIAQHGRAFDWLAEEPDLYSRSDGEPV